MHIRAERGYLLAGRYELTGLIAIGGMGEVWRATDRVLGRLVAVKILKPEHAGDANFLSRFRDEARHAAGLSHPNIATVHDYGEEDGRAFLVMELVDGEALSARLARGGPFTPEAAADVLLQVAAALGVAHRAGIVHRDVKPGNVILLPDGHVKLTDFGIAKAVGASSVTASGMVVGTAMYLSPEQATGSPTSPASDVYALGLLAFEMLTGRTPFTADNDVALAMAHVRIAPPALPPSVPRPLAALVRDSMAKDPRDRPSDADAFAERLRAMRRPPGAVPSPAMAATPLPPTRLDMGNLAKAHRARHRRVLAGAGVAAVIIAGGGGLLAARALDDGGRSPEASAPVVSSTSTASLTTVVPASIPVTTSLQTTTTAPTTAPTTSTSTSTTSTTVLTVPVVEKELIGRAADQVIEYLDDLGLDVTWEYQEDKRRNLNRVVGVEPNGVLAVGTLVVVYVGGDGSDGDDD